MKTKLSLALALAFSLYGLTGCGNGSDEPHEDGTHTHADGTVHKDGDHDHPKPEKPDDHDHGHDHGEEVALPTATIGGMQVELAQGHGAIQGGKESHLVVKLPYNDKGETIVRAWIGTEDRTLSTVGKGNYAPSHDDYDIHTMAPNPLPASTMWWIEIEKPDGTKAVGSAKPILQ